MGSNTSKPELIVIVGETASGKSALALKIAKEFNGEIISADSWAVYKRFDIGTAKPAPEDIKAVPHHLISIADPEEGFNAPKFKRLAEETIQQIWQRGNLPIVVGGTGLYIDSLIFDYSFLPRDTESQRERLNSLNIDELLKEARSENIDLKSIDIRNKRRIIRAIESRGQIPRKNNIKEYIYVMGLKVDRNQLREKIEDRINIMFQRGLPEEVKALSEKYGWQVEPMKGIGYKEFKEHFEGTQSLERTKERIISNTMSLAKRQRTWFKRNPSIQWFSSPKEAYLEVCSLLNT